MVAARRAVSDAGHYAAAAETVAVTVARYLAGRVCDGETTTRSTRVRRRRRRGFQQGGGGCPRGRRRDAHETLHKKQNVAARSRLDANKRRDARESRSARRHGRAPAHEREDTLRRASRWWSISGAARGTGSAVAGARALRRRRRVSFAAKRRRGVCAARAFRRDRRGRRSGTWCFRIHRWTSR